MQNTAENAGLTVSFSPSPSLSLSLRLSRAFQLVAAVVSCIVVVSVCVGVWVCAAAWLCGCAFPQSSHFHPPRWPQFGAVFGRLWTRVPCPSSSPSRRVTHCTRLSVILVQLMLLRLSRHLKLSNQPPRLKKKKKTQQAPPAYFCLFVVSLSIRLGFSGSLRCHLKLNVFPSSTVLQCVIPRSCVCVK